MTMGKRREWRQACPTRELDARHICDRRFADLQLGMILGRAFPQFWTHTDSEYWDTMNGLIIEAKGIRLPWQ